MAGIDKIMSDDQLDVIVGTPTGRMITVASYAGYPVGTVPLGYTEFDSRPFGLAIIAKAGREGLI
jgi:amidase